MYYLPVGLIKATTILGLLDFFMVFKKLKKGSIIEFARNVDGFPIVGGLPPMTQSNVSPKLNYNGYFQMKNDNEKKYSRKMKNEKTT
jgi:hypothetical protein